MYSERVFLFPSDIVEDADALIADHKTLLAVERLLQGGTEAVIQIGPVGLGSMRMATADASATR